MRQSREGCGSEARGGRGGADGVSGVSGGASAETAHYSVASGHVGSPPLARCLESDSHLNKS